jgi:hypothetical protein
MYGRHIRNMNDISDLLIDTMWSHRHKIAGDSIEKTCIYRITDRLHMIYEEKPNEKIGLNMRAFSAYTTARIQGLTDEEAYAISLGILGKVRSFK